ncbi:MAG: RibD family protein, partial [Rudaea sp.]
IDDPRLTVRLPDGEAFVPALRVVLDARLDALSASAHLLDGSTPTLIVHAEGAQPCDDRYVGVERVAVAAQANGRIDLDAALAMLAARSINELQVEAGPTLCGALFATDMVDELLLYVAPILLGDAARPLLALPALAEISSGRRLRVVDERRIGEDWRLLLRE